MNRWTQCQQPAWVTKMLQTGTSLSHLWGCATSGWGGERLGREGAGGRGHAPEGGPFDRKVDWDSVIPGPGARKCPRRFGVLGRPAERPLRRFVLRPVSSCPSRGAVIARVPRQPIRDQQVSSRSGPTRLSHRRSRAAGDRRLSRGCPARASGHSRPCLVRVRPWPEPSARGRVPECAPLARATGCPRGSRPEGARGQRQEVTSVRVPFSPFLVPTPFCPQGSRFPVALGLSSRAFFFLSPGQFLQPFPQLIYFRV